MTLAATVGLFILFGYIAAYLFIMGIVIYGLLTFWKFIVTMILCGLFVSLLLISLVLLL